MDLIKKAFNKIKKDISGLKEDILEIRSQINNIQTIQTDNQLQLNQQTNKPTHNYTIQPPYTTNNHISIGNEGVPTNKQTHQQTHQQTQNNDHFTPQSEFKQAKDILNSLDDIKKGIRLKFKQLTPQEMLIFNVLYGLDEEKVEEITYKIIANKTNLSESSIRDYINKLIKKGIPVEKTRKNNKTIILNISQDLKNITTLTTIQNLRAL